MAKPKAKTVFVCDACGNESPKWEGRCPACRQWNTLAEVRIDRQTVRDRSWLGVSAAPAQQLSEVSTERLPRLKLSSNEVNRVMGGGIVPGSLTLLAGDPGIGKSTLLLRMAADVSEQNGKTLYVSGEESAAQVRMRADRLGVSGKDLYLLPATSLEEVLGNLEEHKPDLAVVDSIQTLYDDALSAEAGSVAQIRNCTRRLTEWAKDRQVPVILSGHVTKSGDIAGPRVLEHMVDVVLYMEGESVNSWRLLRTVKNRFGSTNEIGIFEMKPQGLIEVENPSLAFLSQRPDGAIGSAVVPTLEGSRPLLVEIQALTNPTSFGLPRRTANGIDFNRLLIITAVLSKRLGLRLGNQDVLVNVISGLKIGEPAADLGIALAIISSFRDVAVDPQLVAVGEIGLSGELRAVSQLDRRVNEAARLGFKQCIVPKANVKSGPTPKEIKLIPASTLQEAIKTRMVKSKPRGKTDQA